MGCRRGCDSGVANLELIVKDLIRQMIEDGRLQEGLKDCEGNRLRRDWNVLTCELLGDAVCQLIDDGLVCFTEPQAVTYDSGTLNILMTNGRSISTTLPIDDIVRVNLDGTVIELHKDSGETLSVDLAELLRGVATQVDKSEDGTVTIRTGGDVVTIDPVRVDGTSITKNNNGELAVVDKGSTPLVGVFGEEIILVPNV